MVGGMVKYSIQSSTAEAKVKLRRTAYKETIREFDRDNKPPGNQKVGENQEH
jgi:hypothetical protein